MPSLTREQIIEIRDRFLPAQGEDFNWVGFCNELVESAAGDAPFRYIGDAQRLELRPGDIVVLKVPVFLKKEQREQFAESFKRHFPEHKLLVLDGRIELGIVSPTDLPRSPAGVSL